MNKLWETSNAPPTPSTTTRPATRNHAPAVCRSCSSTAAPPSPDRDDTVYDIIRADLVARGMSPGAVQFIQDYPKPKDKRELFAACRRGEVKVLIGSSETMGTGMNVQKRATALYHVDCPWRPADLEQREGRIIRQGNQNKTVEIINIVGERSYDTTKWQTVEKKSAYIEQLRRGAIDFSEAEDIGSDDMTSSMAATKAAATGDPRYIEVVELETRLRKLNAEARAHRSDQERIKWQLHDNRTRLPILTKEIEEGREVADALTAWGELPRKQRTLTVGGRAVSFAEPAEVRKAVQTRLAHIVRDLERQPDGQHMVVEIAGAEISMGRLPVGGYAFRLTGGIVRTVDAEVVDLALGSADGGSGMVTRLTNMAADLPAAMDLHVKDRDYMVTQTEQLADKLGVPFAKTDEITRLTHLQRDAGRPRRPGELARGARREGGDQGTIGGRRHVPRVDPRPQPHPRARRRPGHDRGRAAGSHPGPDGGGREGARRTQG
ncbi:helicase-related protein [Rhodococcus sp. 3A]|uniref:helicase-related protein n=1 Tax=Rhodococcus sp. 3A TaxID=2834581 RepID=UPI00163B4144|nr:helicase-related protein [Rhodococcus sp. 3A]MBC2644437.1 hypothetical protein [Rhodococcus sp. 3A]